jgi:hypothetical protein
LQRSVLPGARTSLLGWNPATVEAVGSIATVATLVFVIWATFASKKAADAAKESADNCG